MKIMKRRNHQQERQVRREQAPTRRFQKSIEPVEVLDRDSYFFWCISTALVIIIHFDRMQIHS